VREPLPVTDEDRRSAFEAMYTTKDYPPPELNLDIHHDRHLLEQLGKVLENDRKRVIARTPETP
jgi:hypothetical protein